MSAVQKCFSIFLSMMLCAMLSYMYTCMFLWLFLNMFISPVENQNDLELDLKVFFFVDSCC